MTQLATLLDQILRVLLLAALVAGAALAVTGWAVRRGHLEPFGRWARVTRRWGDPLLSPVERWLVRSGRNPQEGPVWLLGIVAVGGILLLSVSRWVVGTIVTVTAVGRSGPLALLSLLVSLAYSLLLLSLLVRVIGSWVGGSRWTPLIRWSFVLTDWIVLPIQRRLPPFGPFDVSPVVAYILLLLVRGLILALL